MKSFLKLMAVMALGFVICESFETPRVDLQDELGFTPTVQLAQK